MGARYITTKPLVLAGERREAGFEFDTDDFGLRRYEMMERRGDILAVTESSAKSPSVAPAEDEDVAPGPDGPGVAPLPDESEEEAPETDEPEEEAVDLETMTRPELIELIENAGVTLDMIDTTGANGYATLEDLKAAARDLELG
jgi:hypothetical protein